MKSPKLVSINPSNYRIIGEISSTTHEEITDAVTQARAASAAWSTRTVTDRVTYLEKLYQQFVRRKDDLRLLIAQEMGMPLSVCDQIDIDPGLAYMRGYLDYAHEWLAPEVVYEDHQEIHYLFYESRGVAAVSVPWNYPFCNFIWGVIQNLVVGNTVVVKHSELCNLTAKLLEEIIAAADLPHGVCQVIYGTGNDAGDYLMNSQIDLLWFTGSTKVGKHLASVAATKLIPAILELGGSAPGIIFEDADLTITIPSIYNNRFLNSGQTCDGLKRLIVHESIADTVIKKLVALIRTKNIGPADNPTTDIGPLACEQQLHAIEQHVADARDKGAQIIVGGRKPEHLQGAYYEPTVVTQIDSEMLIWKEEMFGPVLPIVTFKTEEEAVMLANSSPYGLGGYIYTNNRERSLRVSRNLQTGNICVNDAHYYGIVQDPFGGYKNSGLGREHGKIGLRELMQAKLVALKK